MDDANFLRIIDGLAKLAGPYASDVSDIASKADRLLLESQERLPTGGKTAKARQAEQALRNPKLATTHVAAGRQAALNVEKTSGKAFAKDLMKAVKSCIVHYQARLEVDAYAQAPSLIERSREDAPIASRQDVEHLVAHMGDRGIAAYQLGRIPGYALDLIAKLIEHSTEDRDFEREDNMCVRLLRAGFFDAYNEKIEVRPDERRLLEEAAAARGDPETTTLRDSLERRLGRTLDVSPSFAAGCELLMQNADELSEAEMTALWEVNGEQAHEHSAFLAKLLNLKPDETKRVDAFVRFVANEAPRKLSGDIATNFLARSLTSLFDTLYDRQVEVENWLPEVGKFFLSPGGMAERAAPDEATFWSILCLAIERCSLSDEIKATALAQREDEAEQGKLDMIEYLTSNRITHYLTTSGWPAYGEPDEDEPNLGVFRFDDEPDADEKYSADSFDSLRIDGGEESAPPTIEDDDVTSGAGGFSQLASGDQCSPNPASGRTADEPTASPQFGILTGEEINPGQLVDSLGHKSSGANDPIPGESPKRVSGEVVTGGKPSTQSNLFGDYE